MPLNSVQIITAIGQNKLTEALGTELAVQITEVALGDGNGLRYDPSQAQTSLKNERLRRPITRRHMSDERTWRVTVEFGTDVPNFAVREIGFFNGAGDLIFIVAGAEMVEGTTGAYDLLYDAFLNLSTIKDGLIEIVAPDDVTFDLCVTTGIAIANLQLIQLRQADAIRAAQLA